MPKVIVVDDDPTNITLLQLLLELDGFTVNSFVDVNEAKNNTEADTVAFVVDYHLARGANGLELLRAIRQGETAVPADCIVIITSGDYRRRTEAKEAGANLFLQKPYPPGSLSKKIKQLLAGEVNHGW